jgi:hypothetical protein
VVGHTRWSFWPTELTIERRHAPEVTANKSDGTDPNGQTHSRTLGRGFYCSTLAGHSGTLSQASVTSLVGPHGAFAGPGSDRDEAELSEHAYVVA